MSVLSEYENNPELHIQKLKIKQRQIIKLFELFNLSLLNNSEKSENSESILNKIREKLQEYKEQYPEYFI
jgi:hypothetical protein